MPGLSQDPDKRARQLAGLQKGRITQARAVLAGLEADDAPAPPAKKPKPDRAPARARDTRPPAADGLPTHTYPDIPEEPARETPRRAEPEPEQPARRRGIVDAIRQGFAE